MTIKELPHIWFYGQQPTGRASSMYFVGDTIYSYGEHFPIATILEIEGTRIVIRNTDTYSVTTAKHQRYVRQAIDVNSVMLFDTDVDTLQDIVHEDYVTKCARVLKLVYTQIDDDLVQAIRNADKYLPGDNYYARNILGVRILLDKLHGATGVAPNKKQQRLSELLELKAGVDYVGRDRLIRIEEHREHSLREQKTKRERAIQQKATHRLDTYPYSVDVLDESEFIDATNSLHEIMPALHARLRAFSAVINDQAAEAIGKVTAALEEQEKVHPAKILVSTPELRAALYKILIAPQRAVTGAFADALLRKRVRESVQAHNANFILESDESELSPAEKRALQLLDIVVNAAGHDTYVTIALSEDKKRLHTSGGVTLPTKILSPYWESMLADQLETLPEELVQRVGGYPVHRITPDAVVVGCHTISRYNLQLCAAQMLDQTQS